jgi:hypothetical protein
MVRCYSEQGGSHGRTENRGQAGLIQGWERQQRDQHDCRINPCPKEAKLGFWSDQADFKGPEGFLRPSARPVPIRQGSDEGQTPFQEACRQQRMFSVPCRKRCIPHQKGPLAAPTLSLMGTLPPNVLPGDLRIERGQPGAALGPSP